MIIRGLGVLRRGYVEEQDSKDRLKTDNIPEEMDVVDQCREAYLDYRRKCSCLPFS